MKKWFAALCIVALPSLTMGAVPQDSCQNWPCSGGGGGAGPYTFHWAADTVDLTAADSANACLGKLNPGLFVCQTVGPQFADQWAYVVPNGTYTLTGLSCVIGDDLGWDAGPPEDQITLQFVVADAGAVDASQTVIAELQLTDTLATSNFWVALSTPNVVFTTLAPSSIIMLRTEEGTAADIGADADLAVSCSAQLR